MENNNRLIWADSMKGFLALTVILGHCIQSIIGNDASMNNHLWCYIFTFHMPAFVAISGYLNYRGINSKPINLKNIISRRFRQLLVPFFVWSFIFYLIRWNLQSYYRCILSPTDTFWFPWALFYVVILFSFVDWLSQKTRIKQEVLMLATCVICAGTMALFQEIRIFGIQYVLYYILFYCIGYYIRKYELYIKGMFGKTIVVLLWLVLGFFWHPWELPDFIHLTGTIAVMLRFGYKFFVGFVFVIGMFSIMPSLLDSKNKMNLMLSKFGTVSLCVYTFHASFMAFLFELLTKYIDSKWIAIWISFIILTLLSYFVVPLFGKNKWTSKILLGKI